jgi:hypothetical protein
MTMANGAELAWLARWISKYEDALEAAVDEGQTSTATAQLRVSNAHRFVHFVRTGDLRIRQSMR